MSNQDIFLCVICVCLLLVFAYVSLFRYLWSPIYLTPYAERLKDKRGYEIAYPSDNEIREDLQTFRPWLVRHPWIHVYGRSACVVAFSVGRVVRKIYWKDAHPKRAFNRFVEINNTVKKYNGRLFLLPTWCLAQGKHLEIVEQENLDPKSPTYTADFQHPCPSYDKLILAASALQHNVLLEDTISQNIIYDKQKRIWWFWDCTDPDLFLDDQDWIETWNLRIDNTGDDYLRTWFTSVLPCRIYRLRALTTFLIQPRVYMCFHQMYGPEGLHTLPQKRKTKSLFRTENTLCRRVSGNTTPAQNRSMSACVYHIFTQFWSFVANPSSVGIKTKTSDAHDLLQVLEQLHINEAHPTSLLTSS